MLICSHVTIAAARINHDQRKSAAAAGKIVLCEIAAAVSGLKVQGKCCNIKPKANR